MTQAINLANFANNVDSSGNVTPTALSSSVPLTKGGTGASSAAAARTNLGAAKGAMSSFEFVESGTNLYIKYNGAIIAAISSTGVLTTASDITAYGSL